MNKVLGIIPARAGSKGVKYKNKRLVCGKPLIQYTIESAKKSELISDIVVSTDDNDILDLASSLSVHIVNRKDNISNDTSAIELSIEEVLKIFTDYDTIVLLQPTSPMRDEHDIDTAIRLFDASDKTRTLTSVTKIDDCHPARMYKNHSGVLVPLDSMNYHKRRQDLEELFIRNGCLYIFDKKNFQTNNKVISKEILPYEMSAEKSINVDREIDLLFLELVIQQRS
jgi:CMP-N,N'-diacetyllegionaminic acid synthase